MKRVLSSAWSLGLGLVLLAGCSSPALQPQAGKPAEPSTKRTIYMSAVEYKGSASVEKEPFPAEQPPPGGGYVLKAPEQGQWQTSTYRFEPGSIVVRQGDQVELRIWGVNGAQHHTEIEGLKRTFVVQRGRLTTVNFTADQPGVFRIVCHDHQPSMVTELTVLPR